MKAERPEKEKIYDNLILNARQVLGVDWWIIDCMLETSVSISTHFHSQLNNLFADIC